MQNSSIEPSRFIHVKLPSLRIEPRERPTTIALRGDTLDVGAISNVIAKRTILRRLQAYRIGDSGQAKPVDDLIDQAQITPTEAAMLQLVQKGFASTDAAVAAKAHLDISLMWHAQAHDLRIMTRDGHMHEAFRRATTRLEHAPSTFDPGERRILMRIVNDAYTDLIGTLYKRVYDEIGNLRGRAHEATAMKHHIETTKALMLQAPWGFEHQNNAAARSLITLASRRLADIEPQAQLEHVQSTVRHATSLQELFNSYIDLAKCDRMHASTYLDAAKHLERANWTARSDRAAMKEAIGEAESILAPEKGFTFPQPRTDDESPKNFFGNNVQTDSAGRSFWNCDSEATTSPDQELAHWVAASHERERVFDQT